jgi:IS5 family transposase
MGQNILLNGQKKQRRFYSGKQKRHTLKSQIVINRKDLRVICLECGVGREHDFRLFKRSKLKLQKEHKCLADKGYQGIKKYHDNSQTPHKKTKKKPLTSEQRKSNRELARERVVVEHVIRRLKVWRIMGERYRNRRRRHGLRLSLLAAIYNHELTLANQSQNSR